MDIGARVVNLSSGKIDIPINTGVSSVISLTPREAVSAPIKRRQKRRRKGSADANTLLAIAQSALARLNDVGIGVYVDNWEGEWKSGVVITLTNVKSKDKRLVRR